MKKIELLVMAMVAATSAMAQHLEFPDDALQRGYYDRPYLRYEAEPDRCQSEAVFLLPEDTYTQTPLQAEASNLTAASLVAKGDYVEWTCDEAADGMTIRFSLPDAADGSGIKGVVGLYVNEVKVRDIELDSYWAWQYTKIQNVSEKYPDNTPATTKFARMRFDEANVLLDEKIPQGATFRLVKEDDNTEAYTIDFVELEPVPAATTFESIEDENKVQYDGSISVQAFVNQNSGKTLFFPEGTYTINRKLTISSDNTKIVGAGMWRTTFYFSASSDDHSTYSRRGIETSRDGIVLDGVSLTTINNKRYYDNNSAYQVGKGLMGSWGKGSVIRNVRVDHFECGGWIADYSGNSTDGLLIQHCRFRNNYADGINLCSGVGNTIVEHCSFRNNGDDDQASWSTGNMAHDNVFRYNTAENNWRASSLGFFGGENNKAHHIVVIDAMEAGIRANGEFSGCGFSSEGECSMTDISIYRSGSIQGVPGTNGGFWGDANAAVHIKAGYYYDLQNFRLENIDVYDARYNGVHIAASNSKKVSNFEMHNVSVHGAGYWGILYDLTLKGNGHYSNLKCYDIEEPAISNIPSTFDFTEVASGIDNVELAAPQVVGYDGTILLQGIDERAEIMVYDLCGVVVARCVANGQSVIITDLTRGMYVVHVSRMKAVKVRC